MGWICGAYLLLTPHLSQVGFNAGEAIAFLPLPYSGTDDVIRLDEISGDNEVFGRFLYKISDEWIQRGGCVNITSLGKWQVP